MKKFKRSILVLALAVILAFGATACQPAGGGTETLKGVTSEKIIVGNTAAQTGGIYDSVGVPFNIGVNAAFAAYNAKGGYTGKLADGTTPTNGLKVELVNYDDAGNALNSIDLTTKLIEEDEVFAIVGNVGTACVEANLPIVKEYEVPMIYAASGTGDLYNEKATGDDACVFPVQPVYVTEGKMMLARAFATEENGGLAATKVGVLYNSILPESVAMRNGVEQQMKSLPAALQNNVVMVPVTSSDNYAAAITEFKSKGCDVVIIALLATEWTKALKTMYDNSYVAKTITTYANCNANNFNDQNVITLDNFYMFSSGIEVYSQSWMDITSLTYGYTNTEADLFKAWANSGFPAYSSKYNGVYGYNEEYWTVAENIYNYAITVAEKKAFEYSYDPYALAGYIAGDLFCQGLDALAAAGKELTRANYIDVLGGGTYDLALAEEINYANGARTGVTTFGLVEINMTSINVEGVGPVYYAQQVAKYGVEDLATVAGTIK